MTMAYSLYIGFSIQRQPDAYIGHCLVNLEAVSEVFVRVMKAKKPDIGVGFSRVNDFM